MMTVGELERIVLMLANQCRTRYWKHYNYPVEIPWLMAVEVPVYNTAYLIDEMTRMGFRHVFDHDVVVFTIERKEGDGE